MAPLPKKSPFVQHVKHDLDTGVLSDFGGGLHLREEEPERIKSHPLEIIVREQVILRRAGRQTYPIHAARVRPSNSVRM